MKVALLEAADPSRPGRVFMPMGIAYVGAYLERHESDCRVVVCETLEEALDLQPDLVGVSSVSPSFLHATGMAREIRREAGVPVILGGPHITGVPASLPREFAAGVLGEGEETFRELVRLFAARGALAPEDLAGVTGLVHHSPSGPRLTGPRPLIQPLDLVPPPKRDWPGLGQGPNWSFSSRGCPYRCRFCSTAEFWESYRCHSARYVVDELNGLIDRFGIAYHIFMDDLFAVNVKRLEEIVELARKDLRHPLDLTVTIRADLVTPRMVELLRDLGVTICHLGIESGSDRVLSYLKRESTTAARNQAALDLLAEHGLWAIGSFIIGSPLEDEEDLLMTWDFLTRNIQDGKLMYFTFGPLVAFPGTEVWAEARRRGLVDEASVDWGSLDIDVRYFELERYALLSPLSRERFGYWFERFRQLWEQALAGIPAAEPRCGGPPWPEEGTG